MLPLAFSTILSSPLQQNSLEKLSLFVTLSFCLPLSSLLSHWASLPATPVTVTSTHHIARSAHGSHPLSSLSSQCLSRLVFSLCLRCSSLGSRHRVLPWLVSFLRCCFSVSSLGSLSSPQILDIRKPQNSTLGLFLLCSLPTLFHPWVYMLSIFC